MIEAPSARPIRLVDPGRLASSDRDVRGHTIRDRGGKAFGRIEDLYVDAVTRSVRLLHVDVDKDVLEFDQKLFIPIEAVTETDEYSIWIAVTLEQLLRAPYYDAGRLDDDGYWHGLYDYYGFTPYWRPSYKTR